MAEVAGILEQIHTTASVAGGKLSSTGAIPADRPSGSASSTRGGSEETDGTQSSKLQRAQPGKVRFEMDGSGFLSGLRPLSAFLGMPRKSGVSETDGAVTSPSASSNALEFSQWPVACMGQQQAFDLFVFLLFSVLECLTVDTRRQRELLAQVSEDIDSLSWVSQFVIYPGWTSKLVWDLAVMVVVLLDTFVLPFQLSFKRDVGEDAFDGAWFWITTVCFSADILVTFNTGLTHGSGLAEVEWPAALKGARGMINEMRPGKETWILFWGEPGGTLAMKKQAFTLLRKLFNQERSGTMLDGWDRWSAANSARDLQSM